MTARGMGPMTNQKGFSMMETLLVTGLLAGILIVLNSFMQDYFRETHMRGVADYMQVVQRAVNESLGTLDGFDAIYTLAESNGGAAEIAILDPANPNSNAARAPTGNVSLESGGAGMPPSATINTTGTDSAFSDLLPILSAPAAADGSGRSWGVPLTILVRITDDMADPNDARALESLILTTSGVIEDDLWAAAREMGANGGVVSAYDMGDESNCHADGCAHTARSAYGNWYTDLPDYGVLAAGLAAQADGAPDDHGYLASYAYYNEEMLMGDYLYRRRVTGRPELNQMRTPLDLGGQDIIGVDNVIISGDMEVQQQIYAQGSAYIGQNLQTENALIIEGDMEAGAMVAGPGSADDPSEFGNILVSGDVSGGSLVSRGNVYAAEANVHALSAPSVNAANIVANDVTVLDGGGVYVGTLVNTTDVAVNGITLLDRIESNNTNVNTLGAASAEIGGNLAVSQPVGAMSGGSVEIIRVDGGVDINNLVECRSGC